MKSDGCVALLNIIHYILNLKRITSGNIFLGNLGECVFHIFPRLDNDGGCPPKPSRIFVDHSTIFNSCPMQHLT